MAEEKSRRLKVLEELSKFTKPVGATEIGTILGIKPRDTGNDLYQMGREGLTYKPDEKQSLWLITDKGKKYIENPPLPSVKPSATPPGTPSATPSAMPSVEQPTGEITEDIVPSQADLFRAIGERLRIGVGRGGKQEGTPLDAVIYYVQRTADLDDLKSVWNALTEMGIANDVKRRWIKIYSQTLLGKEIPEDLREKLEIGLEGEKVKGETEGIAPKPKRFSIIGGEIIGDPEGDYTFKEALQYIAQQRGASPDEAGSLALELSKMGPEMLSTILTSITPLLSKEPQKPDTTLSQTLQTLKDLGIIGKEDTGILQTIQTLQTLGLVGKADETKTAGIDSVTKLVELGFLKKPGEGESQIVAEMRGKLDSLAEELHKKDRESLANELTAVKGALQAVRNEIDETRRNQSAKGEFDIMSQALGVLDRRLGSLEQTITGVFRKPPAALSKREKTQVTEAIDEEVKSEGEIEELGQKAWG